MHESEHKVFCGMANSIAEGGAWHALCALGESWGWGPKWFQIVGFSPAHSHRALKCLAPSMLRCQTLQKLHFVCCIHLIGQTKRETPGRVSLSCRVPAAVSCK